MYIKSVLALGIAGVLACLSEPAAAQRADFWTQAGNRFAGETRCRIAGPTGQIKHIVFMQFDNVHFFRDRPNVPSDLELMPSLLNFFLNNGTLMTRHFTPLISHTATNFLSSATGLYPDRMGQPVANSFKYFKPDGTLSTGVSFGYWTAPIFDPTTKTPTDTTPVMINDAGVVAPAPWVPFTRAGCDVGEDGGTNAVLENTSTDVATVFGASSAEAQQVASNAAQAAADFVGIAVHCAQGSSVCQGSTARPDLLPNEPLGYNGYSGLFGHKYVAPQLTANLPLVDLNGTTIADATGHVGFPGFDGMVPAVSLSYAAQMLERGIPVVQIYLSDLHEIHPGNGTAAGPGEASYINQARTYETAFAAFFQRLANDGIDQSNTLFILSSDENDRFVGGAATPSNCDGVTITCSYAQMGELNADIARLLATQRGNTTPFGIHSDMAPVFWLNGNPGQFDPVLRAFTKDLNQIFTVNPISGNVDVLNPTFIDRSAMNFLHMITADPARNANLAAFSNLDYFVFSSGKTTTCTTSSPCVTEPRGFAYNHGGMDPQVAQTFLALAGPGVRALGRNDTIWSDHVDIRPTLLALAGLVDSYTSDGRVITEVLNDNVLPSAARANRTQLEALGSIFKQINAPLGQLATGTVIPGLSQAMLADDATYARIATSANTLTQARNAVVTQMKLMLNNTMFFGVPFDPNVAAIQIQAGQQILSSSITQ